MLGQWRDRKGKHELVLFNRDGRMLKRQPLSPWSLKAGTPLQWNASENQLLMTLTKPELTSGRAGLMGADSMQWIKILNEPIREAQWLPSG